MTTEFRVDTTVDGEWFRAIATVLRGRVESDRDEVTTWLDTQDWRLHDAGLVLTHHRSAHEAWWSLRDEGEGGRLARLPAAPEPGGLDSVPEGAVRERLAAVVGIRALLPRVAAEGRARVLAVTDDDDKTVARVEVRGPVTVHGEDLGTVVHVDPLRGYAADARRLTDLLESLPSLIPAEATVHELAYRAAGLTPGTHRSSPDVEVAPGMPAGEVWAATLGQLLEIVEDNLEGTRRRWDTEFLHDLRVAVRRGRTVVKFGAGVLRDDVRDHLAAELRWLGGQTSLPRDLDVHLLGFDEMAARVRDPGALTPFAGLLAEHRERAHRDLEEALRSVRFDHLVQVWRRDATGAKGADRPVEEVAGEVLARSARKVRRRGHALTADSPAETLHDLRKRAKELRYLLDMFVGLDHHGTTHRVRSATKRLQQALGRHQDAIAQSHLVAQYSRELRSRGASAATLVAMDELATHLAERMTTARADVARGWTKFDHHLDEGTWHA